MANTRSATEIDRHVGSRLRVRRLQVKMSQETLGERMGISFQQVQKYEGGSNRISASRLFLIAHALDVLVAYFFEGLDERGKLAGEGDPDELCAFINSPDGVALAAAFSGIADQGVRRKLIDLARELSG